MGRKKCKKNQAETSLIKLSLIAIILEILKTLIEIIKGLKSSTEGESPPRKI